MLEVQKDRIYERSRLRAKGVTENEIAKAQMRPFKPAFVEGKRQNRESTDSGVVGEVSPAQFAFRRKR